MSIETTPFVVIGAGGLGCPALLGLTAAGARRLRVVDHDRVETSNLQRQVLYGVGDVGMPKVRAAFVRLRARIPRLEFEGETTRLEVEQVPAFVADLAPGSIVLECTDQPALKFAFNDACLAHDVPLVIGAALGMRAQAMAIRAGRACYRCIYEAPPQGDQLPTCEVAGVLGSAVGHAGFVMAALACRLAAPLDSPEASDGPEGHLFAVDVGTGLVQTLAPRPRPNCPSCSE